MTCGGCGGEGPWTFSGAQWLCAGCWREKFGADPPADGWRRP
jgi:hypothetical protein